MFKLSENTEKALNLLRNTNGTISYDFIEKEFGQPIADCRCWITSARKMLERDEGIVFGCIRGEGYKRLSDIEKLQSTETFKKRIHRTAKGGTMRAESVSRDSLTKEEKMQLTISKTLFHATAQATLSDSQKQTS